MGIFADHCDRLWAAGLPAIPLRKRQKAPIINRWQSYANQMPSAEEQAYWRAEYGEGNIGLPLGPTSGLIAIDIDLDDPQLIAVFDQVLPPSPWTRVGRKGKVLIYHYDGQPSSRLRYYNERTKKTESAYEMLSAGTQIVLPPSIHPDTGLAYTCNIDIVDALRDLRSLPPNINAILSDALRRVGIKVGPLTGVALTNFIAPGSRDNTMTAHAGLYATDICRGHKTLLEAIQQMEAWVRGFTEQVFGDTMDPQKGAKKIIEFLIKDVTGPKRKVLPKGWDDGLTEAQKAEMGLSIFTTDHETWNFEQIRQYFDAGLERTGVKDNDEQFIGLARDTIFKIAANRGLDNLEEGRLMRHISDVSGKRIPITEIRKLISEFRAGEIKGTDHTELAQAVKRDFEEKWGEMRFHNHRLWVWEGSFWDELDDSRVISHIATEYGTFKAASKASDHKGILVTLKNISVKPLREKNEEGINFVNGFLTMDLTLKPHDPGHGLTYCLPYPYKPEEAGKCTKWLRMLHDYWGDDPDYAEKVNALGEAIAVTLFAKAPSTQVAFCLYGVAHSGKSRILEIIQELMPATAQCSIPPNMWGDKFGTAPLAGKLLNFAGELSESQLIDSQKLKPIITGETIEGQFKGLPIFNFKPVAAHWFGTNHMPKTRDTSEGFSRRWLFLTFNKKFPVHRRQIDYHLEVVSEERTAIAAWAVQHIQRLKDNNFRITEPPSSMDERRKLDNELSSVRAFLDELQGMGRLRLGLEANAGLSEPTTPLDILWTEYRSYCVSAGVAPVSSKAMSRKLNSLQIEFGFREEIGQTSQGYLLPQYRYLTFAGKMAA